MDWIVTTAPSVAEAQTKALDLLGVDLGDAEVQILEESKTGLFGLRKVDARVRARIKPKAPPTKEDRRSNRNDNRKGRGGRQNRGRNEDRQKSNEGSGNTENRDSKGSSRKDNHENKNDNRGSSGRRRSGRDRNTPDDREEMPVSEQRETLSKFVKGVAKVFSPESEVELVENGNELVARVNGPDLGRLVGPKATALNAFQELARTAMQRAASGRRYHRISVDVDDYRQRRRVALDKFARELAEQVAESGESKAMEPMGAADRKVIHDAVGQVDGVETRSEGRDPRRYIVLVPTNDEQE